MPRLYSPSRTLSFHWPASSPPGLPKHHTTGFGSGRQAVYALARSLAPTGGKVLLPVWVAEGIHLPFVKAGWQIEYYDLDSYANPAWQHLEQRLEQQEYDLVVLIHYFGLPRNTERLRMLIRGRYPILEDWAHSYPASKWPAPASGVWALFSPSKFVGTTDGAWIIGPYPLQHTHPKDKAIARLRYLYWQWLYLIASTLLWRQWPGQELWKKLQGGSYARAYRLLLRLTGTPTGISLGGKWLLAHTDHHRLIDQRIAQARYYAEHLNNPDLNKMLAAGNTTVPWIGFPLWLEDRKDFVDYLAKHNIRGQQFTERWWFEEAAQDYSGGLALLQHHYLLPMHQDFTLEDIATITRIANAYHPKKNS